MIPDSKDHAERKVSDIWKYSQKISQSEILMYILALT